MPWRKTHVGGCGPFFSSTVYFTRAPWTNSYDNGDEVCFAADDDCEGCWSANAAFVSEEEKEINLLLVVGEMFLLHLLEGRREQVVVPAAAAAVAAEKEDVLNVVVVVVISSLSLNSNE